MSVVVLVLLAVVVVWAAWLILSLRRKLSSANVQLSVYRYRDHECKRSSMRLVGTRLTVFCECGRVVGMYLCILVGTEMEVEYGPAIEEEIHRDNE